MEINNEVSEEINKCANKKLNKWLNEWNELKMNKLIKWGGKYMFKYINDL